MPRKCLSLIFPVLFAFAAAQAAAARDVVPAGTILHCTMDEPNFSAKTVSLGDPVLCHLGPLGSFGHSLFPRGAQLSGHLQEYKNPGRLVGKGSMGIEFDRLILPGAEILPLSAKIIAAPHLKVDAQGNIRGKGHPKRDAILWAVPVFWPIKILTLPARGPYPALKGESRLALRLMEDVEVPFATTARNSVPMPPWTNPSSFRSNSPSLYRPALNSPVHAIEKIPTLQPSPTTDGQVTVIALQSGAAVLARQYWVEGTNLHCIRNAGAEQDVPLAMVDLAQTVKVNQERNIEFSLHAKIALEQ